MRDNDSNSGPLISRRGLARAAIGGAAVAALPAAGALPALAAGGPVVGFHADAPWLDLSGRDLPYHPPTATGRFAPDTESLMRLGFFL